MPLELGGTIDENGKLSVFAADELRRWINAHRGTQVVLSLKIKRPKRSNAQNDYYWGVVVSKIRWRMNELGNDFDDEEVHDFLKSKFNAKEIEVIADHFIEVPQSTTKMDTKDFMIYIQKIQQFASDLLDLYIPDPNEPIEINF